jgi:peptidyl-prolyl cis-trans isomerase A (cyclophilin A)
VRILLRTEDGIIEIEVLEDQAPLTSAYFLGLIDRGDYDEATFYRSSTLGVEDGPRLIQGGPLGGLLSKTVSKAADGDSPAFLEIIETTSMTGLRHRRGTVSLARDLVDTGFALPEIFICLGDFPQLDFGGRAQPDELGFPAFGEVVIGRDIAEKIAESETAGTARIGMLEGQILTRAVAITAAQRSEWPS